MEGFKAQVRSIEEKPGPTIREDRERMKREEGNTTTIWYVKERMSNNVFAVF